jgi:hypothetical protein
MRNNRTIEKIVETKEVALAINTFSAVNNPINTEDEAYQYGG